MNKQDDHCISSEYLEFSLELFCMSIVVQLGCGKGQNIVPITSSFSEVAMFIILISLPINGY